MNEPRIQHVANDYEKGDTYKKLFERYNAAIRGEFYLEVIFIAYAIMEDRITRFLCHAGLIRDYPELKRSKGKAKNLVKQVCPEGKDLNNINTRIVMLKKLSQWAQDTEKKELTSKYEIALMDKLVGQVDLAELDCVMEKVENWTHLRNECIHALAKKNVVALDEATKNLALDAYDIIRRLDDLEKNIKKGDNLRKLYNIQ